MSVEAALNSIAGKPVDKSVVIPAFVLNRNDVPGVKKFEADMKELMGKGK